MYSMQCCRAGAALKGAAPAPTADKQTIKKNSTFKFE